ncbi:MAG: sigma-54 dependent transcriptional regulator [Burkholderiales bacterium]
MNTPPKHCLLVVDDEPDLRTLYELTLLREGYDVDAAGSVQEAWQQLGERAYSAVITDMRLPDGTGMDLLRRIEQAGRREKTIVVTAYGSPENAVQALKAGAYDYLTKPVDLKQFRSLVASAVGRPNDPRAAAAATAAGAPSASATEGQIRRRLSDAAAGGALRRMVGQSPAMQQVRSLVDKVARSMAPVLIQGESGTGKELVARSIHQVSSRAARPFIAVNCGAIPEQLLEAEFFGYRKGAFTGANEDREGFFQAAQGGTLFLDELGDLPLSMQSKLLRAIQERAVRPVGAVAELPVDVRVLSATHKLLDAEVAASRFRQDLYYRLNVIEIHVPSLRERLADLPDLCNRTLQRIADESGVPVAHDLTPEAMARLARHPFAGNVRELENLLHRAVALSSGPVIDVDDLGLPALANEVDVAVSEPALPAAAHDDPAIAAAPQSLPNDLAAYLDAVERSILVRALEQHRNNRTAAGASLGLTLRQIRYRIARLGIQVVGDDADPAHAAGS